MNFFKEKEKVFLLKHDLSRKGSIDKHIFELVNYMNSKDCYFTTSSCSGRTIVFSNSDCNKKGCKWIFVSHDIVSAAEIIKSLESHNGSAVLKFEPFVLHTQCLTIEDAKTLLQIGIQAGFKNSGISIGRSGRIIVALRNTLCLEVPLSSEGTLLVSEEYISYIVTICNEKMSSNWKRIERFYANLQRSIDASKECKFTVKSTKKESNKLDKSHDASRHSVDDCEMLCDGISSLLYDDNQHL